jgi:hypothetical protein
VIAGVCEREVDRLPTSIDAAANTMCWLSAMNRNHANGMTTAHPGGSNPGSPFPGTRNAEMLDNVVVGVRDDQSAPGALSLALLRDEAQVDVEPWCVEARSVAGALREAVRARGTCS